MPVWWMSPDWKVRFFRPLASLTLWLDHGLWGDGTVGYHATSLAWYGLALVLLLGLCRAVGLERSAALLAGALYVTTNGAALPVGWIANRNVLLATVATVAAVLVVVRLRAPSGSSSPARWTRPTFGSWRPWGTTWRRLGHQLRARCCCCRRRPTTR